jgi:hypothetical protein
MDWIEGQLDDEAIFPQKIGVATRLLPQAFRVLAKDGGRIISVN